MVTIRGITREDLDKIENLGFVQEARRNFLNEFEVDLSEEIKITYHYGTLTLSDNYDEFKIGQLDFAEVEIS